MFLLPGPDRKHLNVLNVLPHAPLALLADTHESTICSRHFATEVEGRIRIRENRECLAGKKSVWC